MTNPLLGQMMDSPLLISNILTSAARHHSNMEIVSKRAEGDIHRYTVAELQIRSKKLAQALEHLGLKMGSRIGTLAWNGYRHLEIYYGVSGSGPQSPNETKDCSSGSTQVQYVNSENSIIKYVFNYVSGVLTREISPCLAGADTCPVDLISQDSNVNISNMTFFVIGADHEFDADMTKKTQPRVIITASGLISSKGSTPTSFNLQTTASQRIRN